jgi:hypothetical protein
MVKGIVKTNKANDTKYIYLAKDCGFNDGQEVDIKFSGIGIYNKEELKKYFDGNKDMFLQIKKKIREVSKKAWKEFYEQADVFGKYLDYGKLEWDDEFYFEKNNDYSACPEGDIDGGHLGYRIDKEEIKELIKNKKLNSKQIKKELMDYLTINFLQKKSEETIEDERKMEIEMMKEFGFENKEDNRYSGYETTLYSNGIVQLWYNAEDFVYNKTMNISTMKDIDCFDKESNMEF